MSATKSRTPARGSGMSATLTEHATAIARLEGDLETIGRSVADVQESQKRVWLEISKVSTTLTELNANVRAAPKQDFGRLVGVGVSAGGLIAMLVAGITYIVTGSQTPVIKDMQSEITLLKYRIEQLEHRKGI